MRFVDHDDAAEEDQERTPRRLDGGGREERSPEDQRRRRELTGQEAATKGPGLPVYQGFFFLKLLPEFRCTKFSRVVRLVITPFVVVFSSRTGFGLLGPMTSAQNIHPRVYS